MVAKRKFSTFSLSFLDIMSCGFGAVILVFLIIKHDVNSKNELQQSELHAEVNLLEKEVSEGKEHLVKIKNSLTQLNQKSVETNGLAKMVNNEIDAIRNKIVQLDVEGEEQQRINMEIELQSLFVEKKKLEEDIAKGNNARRFAGQGERQYLTGLKLSGSRTLILLDVSASMLDNKIVNIIRRRNMSDNIKIQSAKWQRAVRAVEWLVAKFPLESQFQLYTFNSQTQASVAETTGQWLSISDQKQLNNSLSKLRDIVPQGGTSLVNAFQSIVSLDPLPDNIILITDGLPTQGANKGNKSTISSKDREILFLRALERLPQGIPVNILLWPMEGDPMAASAFWKLAQLTAGSFMSPSKDWP
jgi:small-conductance mechanosensitive channel